jgi:uncharacterized membrane protein
MILLSAALGLCATVTAVEPPKRYQVLTPREIDFSATGINERGDLVGFDWVEDPKRPGVIEQVPSFAKGKEITRLPLLAGYTATSPAAVSDGRVVVGHVGKPVQPGQRVRLGRQAFVWDARGGIRGLGTAEGDFSSFATGISRDGRRISGYSVGDNRVRACVWDRDGDAWKATPLPHASRLASNVVAISGDGRLVAAVDGDGPCLWTRDESGRWEREPIGGPASLVPRAVNNAGTVVGLQYTADGDTHAVAWARPGGLRRLTEPEGYRRSEALAINNQGAIVGMIDGPRGSKVGPNAFVEEDGRLRILDEGGPNFASATAVNDQGQVAGVMEEKED